MYKNKYKKYKLKYLDLKGGSTNSDKSYTVGDEVLEYEGDDDSLLSIGDNKDNENNYKDYGSEDSNFHGESASVRGNTLESVGIVGFLAFVLTMFNMR